MARDGILIDASDYLVRDGKEFYGFASTTDFSDERKLDQNILKIACENVESHGRNGFYLKAAFVSSGRINVAFIAKSPFIGAAASVKHSIPPMLDDLAQIIGPDLPWAQDAARASRILRRRSAVLIPEGCVCVAEDLTDAHAVAMVAEKGCRAAIESAYFGGGHPIPKCEAIIMRYIFLLKYRKKASR